MCRYVLPVQNNLVYYGVGTAVTYLLLTPYPLPLLKMWIYLKKIDDGYDTTTKIRWTQSYARHLLENKKNR
jgi:hypothetical protein